MNEAIRMVLSLEGTNDKFEFASLDHDLGEYAGDGGDGAKFTDWMAENGIFPELGIQIHSANPVGARTMLSTIDRYGPYSHGAGRKRLR